MRPIRPNWLLATGGILMVIVGIIALFNPGATLVGVAFLMGLLIALSGAAHVLTYFVGKEPGEIGRFASGSMLFFGILDVIIGVWLMLSTRASVVALTIFIGIWAVSRALAIIGASVRLKRYGANGWKWLMAVGVVAAMLSVLIIFDPALKAVLVSVWAGLYLIGTGVTDFAAAAMR